MECYRAARPIYFEKSQPELRPRLEAELAYSLGANFAILTAAIDPLSSSVVHRKVFFAAPYGEMIELKSENTSR